MAEKKNPVGHPPAKPSKELVARIVNGLRLGAYIETAVSVAGLKRPTFYEWCKRGNAHRKENKTSVYTEFLDTIDRAQEECTMRDLSNIDKCAMGQEPEYERHADGSLVFNANGNPIVKKLSMRPDWNASAWRLSRRCGKQWGNSDKGEASEAKEAAGPKIIVTLPSNGREAKKDE